jgi:hypothetical protein
MPGSPAPKVRAYVPCDCSELQFSAMLGIYILKDNNGGRPQYAVLVVFYMLFNTLMHIRSHSGIPLDPEYFSAIASCLPSRQEGVHDGGR